MLDHWMQWASWVASFVWLHFSLQFRLSVGMWNVEDVAGQGSEAAGQSTQGAQGVADAFTCPGGIGQLRGQLGHSPAVSLQGLARQADN